MNKKFLTFVSCCVIGTVLQAGGYLYLDQVLFCAFVFFGLRGI